MCCGSQNYAMKSEITPPAIHTLFLFLFVTDFSHRIFLLLSLFDICDKRTKNVYQPSLYIYIFFIILFVCMIVNRNHGLRGTKKGKLFNRLVR